GDQRADFRLGEDRDTKGFRAKSPRPDLDLGGAFLPRHVQDLLAARVQSCSDLLQDGGFPYAWRTTQERERPPHQPTAQHPVEFPDSRLNPFLPCLLHVFQEHRIVRGQLQPASAATAVLGLRWSLHHRIPGRTRGALPEPTNGLVPALLAEEPLALPAASHEATPSPGLPVPTLPGIPRDG